VKASRHFCLSSAILQAVVRPSPAYQIAIRIEPMQSLFQWPASAFFAVVGNTFIVKTARIVL
jgi:hypothetical protein